MKNIVAIGIGIAFWVIAIALFVASCRALPLW